MKRNNLFFIAFVFCLSFFCTQTAQAASANDYLDMKNTGTIPVTENDKVRYLLGHLLPTTVVHIKGPRNVDINKNNLRNLIHDILSSQYFLMRFLVPPAIALFKFNGSRNTIGITLCVSFVLAVLEYVLAEKLQNRFIKDDYFKNSTKSAKLGLITALPWIAYHKCYYNQQLFVDRTITAFELHPEYFPPQTHALLQKIITEYDSMNIKDFAEAYYQLVAFAKPLIKKYEALLKVYPLPETTNKEQKRPINQTEINRDPAKSAELIAEQAKKIAELKAEQARLFEAIKY